MEAPSNLVAHNTDPTSEWAIRVIEVLDIRQEMLELPALEIQERELRIA